MLKWFPRIAGFGLAAYFIGFGIYFIANPAEANNFGLAWLTAAGKTEVRVYYGAFSLAAGLFLSFLLFRKEVFYVTVAGTFYSWSVLVFRLIFTAVDKGWSDDYTTLAFSAEPLFALAMAGALVCEIVRRRKLSGKK
jgi:vacuolar-type H+-ATPase subunit I/STV1